MTKAPAKKPQAAKKDVATLPPKSSVVSTSDFSFDPGMGTGLENVTAGDLLIPRVMILQALSPQVDQTKPLFDSKARVGMIYDVGLQEGFPEGLHILPVHYIKQYLEWYPRKSGKGLAGIHNSADIMDKAVRDERNRPILPNGNYVAETAQFYFLNLDASNRRSFLPMTSTQLKKAKRLLTLATNERLTRPDGTEFNPPLFYRTYRLGTVPESNAEGSWVGWTVERDIAIDQLPKWQNLMMEVRDFRDSLTKGDIRGDIASMREDAGQVIDHEGAM